MKSYDNKNLVFIILLLFVGQVISAPFSTCLSNQADSHSISVVESTSFSAHDMSSMNSNNTSDSHVDMDCCPDDCDCPSGVCFSLVYLLNQDTEINFNNTSDRVDVTNQVVNNQTISSIYRPPIFS